MKKKLMLAVPLVFALGCSAQQNSNDNYNQRDRHAGYSGEDQSFSNERGLNGPADAPDTRGLKYGESERRRTKTFTHSSAPGDQRSVERVAHWISYREFWFDTDLAEMRFNNTNKVSQIVSYLKHNPSVQVGIDSPSDRGISPSRQKLNDRRVDVIRDALMRAGVPSNRIDIGAFSRTQSRRTGMVEVLIASRK